MAEEIINSSVSELAPRSLSDSGIVLTPPTFIFISMLAVTYDILCGSSGLDKHVVGNKSNVQCKFYHLPSLSRRAKSCLSCG